jgi:uncharacterized membrane protein
MMASSSTETKAGARDPILDISRGLIVAVMALDHVRIFFSAAKFEPTDLDSSNAAWFFTRFVTHLCAPGFFFIAGMGAGLMRQRGMEKRDLAAFLATRGAILILLEIFLFGLAWSFDPGWFWFGVIAGLGAAMILLAAALFLPRAVLLVAALAFIFLHNAFWPGGALPHAVNVFVYAGGMAPLPLLGPRIILYPLLPWAALMILGYAAADWLMPGARPQPRRLASAGLAAIALFVLLRVLHFGESAEGGWSASGDGVRQILSFLNVQKYPPSLQFSLVTLGLLALLAAGTTALVRGAVPHWLSPLQVYGRTPFFFYLVHIFLIHALALATAAILGWPTNYLFWSPPGPSLVPPDGYGYGLAGIYAMWLFVLALLYWPCRWFGRAKAARPGSWLRYF